MSDFDELSECRQTIGRMDTLLEDLRKYGFSLVTGLLTAGSLVGATTSAAALPLAGVVVMVLVLALFGIDMYYQVVLSAAVGRAMDLEALTHDPQIRITSSVSRNATLAHTTTTIFFLYATLIVTAMGMGLFGANRWGLRLPVVAAAAVALALMTGYWFYVRAVTRLNKPKARVLGVLRVGRPTTVTVIGSGFGRATRAELDVPGSNVVVIGRDRRRYFDRNRDTVRVTVDHLDAASVGVHTLTVFAGERKLDSVDCLVVADAPVGEAQHPSLMPRADA